MSLQFRSGIYFVWARRKSEFVHNSFSDGRAGDVFPRISQTTDLYCCTCSGHVFQGQPSAQQLMGLTGAHSGRQLCPKSGCLHGTNPAFAPAPLVSEGKAMVRAQPPPCPRACPEQRVLPHEGEAYYDFSSQEGCGKSCGSAARPAPWHDEQGPG